MRILGNCEGKRTVGNYRAPIILQEIEKQILFCLIQFLTIKAERKQRGILIPSTSISLYNSHSLKLHN